MPPRGRGRRRSGQTRADAAMDAMRAYGFREYLISETLRELLKVYGEEGWILIEDASYKVLLEAILEKVEREEEEEKKKEPGDGKAEFNGNSAHHEDIDQGMCSKKVTETGMQAYQPDAASDTDDMVVNSPAHYSKGGGWLLTDSPGVKENSEKKEIKQLTICEVVNTNNTEMEVDEEDNTRSRTTKPCYGWISSEEEDEEAYLVKLKPQPLPENLKRLLMASNRQKRKRWDVSPDELQTSQGLRSL